MGYNEPTASKEKQVWSKLDDLQKALEELEKTANVLGAGLQRVMKSEQPMAKEDDAKVPAPNFCDLAGNINEKVNLVCKIQSYINTLTNRLEV